MRTEPVLVTGSTGYVGGRLIPQLLASGYRVRALGRSLEKISVLPWSAHRNLEIAQADPESVWEPIAKIGGQTGLYFADFLWRIRRAIDSLFGGIGLRKGRQRAHALEAGDTVDFFRVLEVHAPYRIRLIAEMLFPGQATLEFVLIPQKDGITELQRISRYIPRGFSGLVYWCALSPFHQWILRGMVKGIARTVGRPVIWGPRPFTPAHRDVCSVCPAKTRG